STQLKLVDIRTADRHRENPHSIVKRLSVPGECISTGRFISSGLRVAPGDEITVVATGIIRYYSSTCTPDGADDRPGMVWGSIPIFSLAGRTRDGSMPIAIGSRRTFTVSETGVLKFGVACNATNTVNCPGEYLVTVRVNKRK